MYKMKAEEIKIWIQKERIQKKLIKGKIIFLFHLERLNMKIGKTELIKRGQLFCRLRILPLLIFIIMMVSANFILWGQVIINNPEKPKNRRAGRVIQLEEVQRIEGDGKNLILRNPQQLRQLEDGSLIFFDYPYVYKVDKQGKFVFKIPKQGQGPGEAQYPNAYLIESNRLRLYSWVPPKVLEYDLSGKLLKEFKTPYHGPFYFLDIVDGKLYGVRDEIRFSDAIRQEGIIRTPYRLYEISSDFKKLRKIYDIMMEHYIKNAHWVKRAMFTMVPYGHYLFYVHSAEYQIEKFDLKEERVERIFGRRYSPARTKEEEKEEEEDFKDRYEQFPRGFRPPPQHEFYVQRIQIFGDTLWVKTSTEKDEGSKWLIDVFDLNGNYIDCFYLNFPANKQSRLYGFLITNDGFIFVGEEEAETGLLSLAKYKLKSY